MREAILGMENKVKDLRDKIDEIDLKILDLIQSRAIHASKIGEIKKNLLISMESFINQKEKKK